MKTSLCQHRLSEENRKWLLFFSSNRQESIDEPKGMISAQKEEVKK
ncbi:hypothetical protein [Paenibacillus alginolyticus]|nr:hypothetical protein [Paenibacillus alginolyticus]MEC0146699.1 hypothetical protein [Paenibacillus alginolyticus]